MLSVLSHFSALLSLLIRMKMLKEIGECEAQPESWRQESCFKVIYRHLSQHPLAAYGFTAIVGDCGHKQAAGNKRR